ncbi:MAG: radical SAM protein, partial [Snowella sp.]
MMNKQQLITELQSKGLRWVDPNVGASGRKGGAGPSDHKAVTIEGTTVMVPIYTDSATRSPYTATIDAVTDKVMLHHNERVRPLIDKKRYD